MGGAIGGAICFAASRTLVKLKIDDPLDAFPVHGACGAWGCIAVGLFCTDVYTYNQNGYQGLFYGGGSLLGVQILRVSEEEEARGLDMTEHEGPAYMIEKTSGGPKK